MRYRAVTIPWMLLVIGWLGAGAPRPAAALTYQLSVTGGFTGSGQVSGSITEGITAFSFTARAPSDDIILAFDLADTSQTEWAIQEPDDLIGLEIFATTSLSSDPQGTFGLALQFPGESVSIPGACQSATTTTAAFCGPFGGGPEVTVLFGTMTMTPVTPGPQPVPAPAAALLIAAALGLLGIARSGSSARWPTTHPWSRW